MSTEQGSHMRIPFWYTVESFIKIAPQFFLHYIFYSHFQKIQAERNISFDQKQNLSFPGIQNKKALEKKKPGGWARWRAEAAPRVKVAPQNCSGKPPTCSHRVFSSEVPVISPFKTFLSCINKHTLSHTEEFLSPNPSEGPTYLAPKLFSLILWPDECSVIFAKQWLTLPSKFWNTREHVHSLWSVYYWEKAFRSWRRQYKPRSTT